MALRSKEYRDKEKLRKTRNAQRKRYYRQTQGNKPKRWSEDEIQMVLDKPVTDRELSELMNRSMQSIQLKRHNVRSEEQIQKEG